MKYAVTIAKDGTPYFHIEADSDTDTPGDALTLARQLRGTFANFKEEELAEVTGFGDSEPRFVVQDG